MRRDCFFWVACVTFCRLAFFDSFQGLVSCSVVLAAVINKRVVWIRAGEMRLDIIVADAAKINVMA